MATTDTPQTVPSEEKPPLSSPPLSPPNIPSEFSTASAMNTRAKGVFRDTTDGTAVGEATNTGKALGLGVSASLPAVIPPTHSARTLVVCFDGTGDQFSADNSNVVQLFTMLKKDDRKQQMVYYQAGIGTYLSPQVANPFTAKISKTLDEAVAWNLHAHVMGGYEFLMQNYEAGDKICIFGFSRGAYTARSLAGMIHKVGLLPACNHQQVPFAYKMFTRTDKTGWDQSTAFKKAFSMDVDIEFIGVWDTVASVGLIPKSLPFTTSNTAVKTFRHAISLDERRAKFKANHYNHPTEEELKLGVQLGEMPKSVHPTMDPVPIRAVDADNDNADDDDDNEDDTKDKKKRRWESEMEKKFSDTDQVRVETDVLEVWFAGCHCDVGGGSVANGTRHSLARIPLRWMIRQCFLANTGIQFHTELLKTAGLDPATLYPIVKDRPLALSPPPPVLQKPPPRRIFANFKKSDKRARDADAKDTKKLKSEEEEDLADALCPLHDQLKLHKPWWILEILPMKHRIQKRDNSWASTILMNMGHGRLVPFGHHREGPFYVHRSVKTRLEAEGLTGGKYKFKAKHHIEPTWVD